MKIKQGIKVDCFIIKDVQALDPVTVILKDDNSKGKVIIECYGESWSTYFGGIGNKSLLDFVSGLDSGYLEDRLISYAFHKAPKREKVYVNRISQAVIDACKLLNK